MKKHIKKWFIFIWERFPPYIYIPFLLLFFLAHFVFATDKSFYPNIFSLKFLILFIVTLLFFFTLRLFDEVKDFESDLQNYPKRPLSRGLLTRGNIHFGIVICIILELIFFSFFGLQGIGAIAIPILYSLLMFKEFFVKKWIRSHLTFYAVTHTFVSSLFSLTLFSIILTKTILNLTSRFFMFALLSWCLFNIFEFGRKTFITNEEKKHIESYSKIYGRVGATALSLFMALCSLGILRCIQATPLTIFFASLLIGLFSVVSLLFILLNKEPFGKMYRSMSSVFIAFFYLIFIITK